MAGPRPAAATHATHERNVEPTDDGAQLTDRLSAEPLLTPADADQAIAGSWGVALSCMSATASSCLNDIL